MATLATLDRIKRLEAEALDFAPGLLRIERQPPSPLPRVVAWVVMALFLVLLAWSAWGRLDIIAVAPGKLVPQNHLRIVQPSEAGIVQEILVQEGEAVRAGQVLMRMDAKLADADSRALQAELARRGIQVRRIDAELAGTGLAARAGDPPDLLAQARAQQAANRRAYEDALAQEQAVLDRARKDLATAQALEERIRQSLPVYREREAAFETLGREGFAGRIMVLDKQKERMEKEQELEAQGHAVAGHRAAIAQSEKRIAQIHSGYRQQLQNERAEALAERGRLESLWAKQEHRNVLLELKAPAAGVVKDLATHTPGTVVQPGTVLMTLVPLEEPLHAEVWVRNEDAGFVRPGQEVKLKFAAYPFQKYGLARGRVLQVSADATEAEGAAPGLLSYRAVVALDSQSVAVEGKPQRLAPGMQVAAEINLGERTVLEYLLSPVQKTVHEAGRER
jgi:HlyD family secretion protein